MKHSTNTERRCYLNSKNSFPGNFPSIKIILITNTAI